MRWCIRFVLRHNFLVLLAILTLTIASLFLLPSLSFNSEYINLLPPKPEHAVLCEQVLGITSNTPGDLYCLFEGEHIFEKDALIELSRTLDKLDELSSLKAPLSPFSFVTVQKKGTRLATLPLSPVKKGESWTDADALEFKRRLQADDIASGLLSTKEGNAILFQISLQEKRNDQAAIHQQIEALLHPLSAYGQVSFVGTPLFEDRVLFYLSNDLQILLSLCLLVIVLLFFLAFRSIRAVLLPFSLSLIALIWTLACMALLQYELTVVNVIIPSMVLILGSSYAVHVLNEYYRCLATAQEENGLIEKAVGKISKTIFGASLTTIVGFLSLLICDLQAFRELGIAVSIGIFFCAMLSIFYLPAVLSLLPNPKKAHVRHFSHGKTARLVHKLTLLSVRLWPLALVLAISVFILFLTVQKRVALETDYLTYFPKNDPIINRSVEFAQKIGGSDPHYITLTTEGNTKQYFLQPEVLKQVYAFEQYLLDTNEDINHLFSFSRYVAFLNKVYQGEEKIPDTPGLLLTLSRLLKVVGKQMQHPLLNSLINEDGSMITLTLRSYDSRYQSWESLESVQNLQRSIEKARPLLPKEIQMEDWGVGVDALRMSRTIKQDQDRSLVLSLVVVFLIVLFQFKSLKIGIFALIPTLTGIMGNYLFMYAMDIPFDVITIIFASITVGVGVDAAIHFLLRFCIRTQEHPNLPYTLLITQTLEETARPILLSSTSLVLGLLVLRFASFLPIQYFGLLLAFALVVTTFSTLFILPALMIALHKLTTGSRKLP